MLPRFARELRGAQSLLKANTDAHSFEGLSLRRSSLLTAWMGYSKTTTDLRNGSFSFAAAGPDEIDPENEDILQESTESEDDDISELEEEDDD
jgi:hypothetical protein